VHTRGFLRFFFALTDRAPDRQDPVCQELCLLTDKVASAAGVVCQGQRLQTDRARARRGHAAHLGRGLRPISLSGRPPQVRPTHHRRCEHGRRRVHSARASRSAPAGGEELAGARSAHEGAGHDEEQHGAVACKAAAPAAHNAAGQLGHGCEPGGGAASPLAYGGAAVQGADDDDDDDDEEEADEQVGRDDGAQTDDEDDMEEDAPLRAAARCYRPRRAAYACSMLRG
jgi:hypothetical protein